MNRVRHHLRLATWLALLAMAALALLPTLSHALASTSNGGNFTEVCTPQGMKLVALADGETAPDSAALHLEHCPWCMAASAHLAPPPAAQPLLPPPTAAGFVPPLFLHAPRPLFAWARAQPRAPPVSS